MTPALRRFLAAESSGGIVLAIAAILALVVSNSPWRQAYEDFWHIAAEIRLNNGSWSFAKPLVVWINDLWMAVFFFLVGLEIKREFSVGELAEPRQRVLPVVAALGGMAVPALIYAFFNHASGSAAAQGWAIPSATDIAFAIGIITLLGSRVPTSLKVFLTAVAIIDDLGAIVVIALFYTHDLQLNMLWAALACVGVLVLLNRTKVENLGMYALVGLVMWFFILKSGVHATLAGVLTAWAVPLHGTHGASPLEQAEHALHPWVAFLILPVFAFANAGIALAGVEPMILVEPVTLGIFLGLCLGKPVGVLGSAALVIFLGWAQRPSGASWQQLLGVSVLCGIGFTMSLFIGELAFAHQPALDTSLKLGVLLGSLCSGVLGAWILLQAKTKN